MEKSWLRKKRVPRLGGVVLYRMGGEASVLGYINQRPPRRGRATWVILKKSAQGRGSS